MNGVPGAGLVVAHLFERPYCGTQACLEASFVGSSIVFWRFSGCFCSFALGISGLGLAQILYYLFETGICGPDD